MQGQKQKKQEKIRQVAGITLREKEGMRGWFRHLGAYVARLFQKRSIIIITEQRTNHVAVGSGLQIAALAAVVACVGLASYSTGSYMAARSVLQEKDETIRSVTSSRVDTSFPYALARVQSVQTQLPTTAAAATAMTLIDPAYSLAAMGQDKLYARIALLENKVKELKSANAEIIQTVRERATSKILNMEEIIRQTGMNTDALKREAATKLSQKERRESRSGMNVGGPQGGPFIPAETAALDPVPVDLERKLDQLALLNEIVTSLPLARPLAGNAELQSNFGRRVDPFTGRLAFHAGVDLTGPAGSQVRATGAGRVVSAGWMGAYGNAVDVDHGYGVTTRYGHMSQVKVSEGSFVKRGDVLGVQGSTGRSTGAHVHYEVRLDNRPVNPTSFINAGYHVSKIQ